MKDEHKMAMGGMAKNSAYKKGGKIDGCAKRLCAKARSH
jgi:hypothetical protein